MFLRLLSGEEWVVAEDGIDPEKIRFQETIFTLGNGYLGCRGILEEGHEKGCPGTYFAGVYDRSEGQSYELVNAPNPVCVEIYADGKKLSLNDMEVVEHRRVLDVKKAALLRRTVFKDGDRRYEYESVRFFSLNDVHTGAVAFTFRSLDSDTRVVVKHIIDGTTENAGQAVGSPIKHYAVTCAVAEAGDDAMYLEAKTNDYGILLGMAAAIDVKGAGLTSRVEWQCLGGKEFIGRECAFKAEKGKKYRLDIYLSMFTSREQRHGVKKACLDGVKAARKRGFAYLFRKHVRAWEDRWQYSDVRIEGNGFLQRAVRFNIYHLLAAAPSKDIDVSMGAKTLSGEWYKGHVFWDTEIFVLPLFVFTQPEIAKNFLLYRYRRLEQAREGARAQGYRGALWPWESAASGRDETPQTWVNFDGTVIPVHTSKREHHIAGDIVYGISLYHRATADDDFMFRYGAEMVFETARFWASRATCNPARGCYEIREVIGPNEFQECVHNNSYTNALARWTLRYAAALYHHLQKHHLRRLNFIAKKIGLSSQEVSIWEETAEKILFLISPEGLIEEFEGYFRKRDVIISELDENGMPVWPAGVSLAEAKETQLVKQADVILLLQLFSGDFSPEVKRVNFDYYVRRTTHKSSLSLSSYAVIALELGDVKRAYEYFMQVAKTDLADVYGNTELGIHAAALGGVWQIIGYGFAGIKLVDGMLRVNPVLPEQWHRLNFRLWFKKALIEFDISKGVTKAFVLKIKGKNREGVELEIYGKRYFLRPGEEIKAKER